MINGADTAFILAAAGLVLLMTPGLALFYAGMVRSKNVLGTIMQSLILISLVSLEWVYIGYSMAFGPDWLGLTGDLSWAGLRGVTNAPSGTYATTIPQTVFMIYQCMFAVITPALIAGAFAERVRFRAFVAFSLFWSIQSTTRSATGSGAAEAGWPSWEWLISPAGWWYTPPAAWLRWPRY